MISNLKLILMLYSSCLLSSKKLERESLTNNFTTNQIFVSRNYLIEWVRGKTYDLGFVVVIVRFNVAIGVSGRKKFVILGCERGEKYRKYKADAVAIIYETHKYECPFRLKGKSCSNGDANWC
ncbi:hypothetical protein V8G54_011652 [Vigna mungo]|uniref:Uncharacterized protein n=1 Tax=Vigna mungo TaxID=3915 RepID=A0AAQ3S338_VIGMU